MILASAQDINKYETMGIWGTSTILDIFKRHVQKNPDQICIIDPLNKKDLTGSKPEKLTYKEFDRAVNATAEGLIKKGIGKDNIIMVQLPNCWELAMLYLAIARTGAVISPVPVLLRKAELSNIAEITKTKAFIIIEKFNGFNHKKMAETLQPSFPELKHIITYEEIRKMSRGKITGKLDNIHINANDIFTICWTSGTEAMPKGCPLSHNNWIGVSILQDATGIKPGDTFMITGPLVNMASVGTIFLPWAILGGTMIIHHPFDLTLFMKQIIKEKVNYMLLVPAILNIIAKHPQVDALDLSCVRSITTGSAAPSLWTLNEFKKRWGIEIGNLWGQNEGSGIVAGSEDIPDMELRVDHFPHFGKSGAKWKSKAARFIETKIIDMSGNELTDTGDVGELIYKGPGVIPSYFNSPEMTKKGFAKEGYLKTGDLFKIEKDNLLSFFERCKDIIIRGGYNISSQEIENYLLGHPKVQDAAIIGIPDDLLGEKVCACIVPASNESVSLDDLTDLLLEKGVARYKHPEKIAITDIIPRNSTGKIVKNILREKNLKTDLKHL